MSGGCAITRKGDWLLLAVKARPGAKSDRIRGIAGGFVLVDVAAAPEDGKATERLLQYLALRFGVARRDVELMSGEHARWKRVRIHGATLAPDELGPATDS